jgi:hypothetical protein
MTRVNLAFALSGLFLFFLGALILVTGVYWTPMGPRLGFYMKIGDFVMLLAAFLVFLPGFVFWAGRHQAFRKLPQYRAPTFLLHLAILYGATVFGAWGWSLAAVNPLVKLFALATLGMLVLPSLRQVAGFVMRVVFFTLLRTGVPAPAAADPVEQFALPSYTPPSRFYQRTLQCLNQARRFDLQIGILLIAFDRGQIDRKPDHPAVERPLLHQLLFLLTELNRQYEPWTYLHGRGIFMNALLLSGPHHVGPICDRFARILRDRARGISGEPLGFRILAARRKAVSAVPSPSDRAELQAWVEGLVDELERQKEPVHIQNEEA